MRIPIVSDGYRFIIPLLLLSGISIYFCLTVLSIILSILTIFVISFFRDPEREILVGEGVVVSPADGKVVKILVKQIAGLIARRIVCWVKEGDRVERGMRYGLIRFGSRVDIFLPPDTELNVKVGDKIKGGIDVIGRLR